MYACVSYPIEDCQSSSANADTNENTNTDIVICKYVETTIQAIYNPGNFPTGDDIVELYITSNTLRYLTDETGRDIAMESPAVINLQSQVTLTLSGVANIIFEQQEANMLNAAVYQFLQEMLAGNEPPVNIVVVEADANSNSTTTSSARVDEHDGQMRVRRGAKAKSLDHEGVVSGAHHHEFSNHHSRQLKKKKLREASASPEYMRKQTDHVNVLTVNVTVSGEYLLPTTNSEGTTSSDINNDSFSKLIETYYAREEDIEYFLSILKNNSGDEYFSNVQNVSALAVALIDDAHTATTNTTVPKETGANLDNGQNNSSDDDDGPFGALGDAGGVGLLVACNAAVIGLVAFFWVKQSEAKTKHKQVKEGHEEGEDFPNADDADTRGDKNEEDVGGPDSSVADFSASLDQYPYNTDSVKWRESGENDNNYNTSTINVLPQPIVSVSFDRDEGESKDTADNKGYSLVN